MELFSYDVGGLNEIETCISDFKSKCPENPSSILALVFTSYDDAATIGDFTRHLSSACPGIIIAGCTTSAAIRSGGYSEGTTTVSFLVFERTKVKTEILDLGLFSQAKAAKKLLTTAVLTKDLAGVCLLMTLKSLDNMYPFGKAFSSLFHDIPVFGGSADSSFSIWPRAGKEYTYVFTDEFITEQGVLALFFSGKDLHIFADAYLGWKPLGREYTVTKTDGNLTVMEIADKPASMLYEKYIGVNQGDKLFESLLAFPYVLSRHGRLIARAPQRFFAEGSVKFAAEIHEGEKVRLSYGDPTAMLNGVKQRSADMMDFAPQAILLISCVSRLLYLHDEVNGELSLYQAIAPTAGVYAFGEILRFPEHKDLEIMNNTLLAIGLREGEPIKKEGEKKEKKVYNASKGFGDERLSLVRGLANFVSVTSRELEEANEKLMRLANEDRLTEIMNRGAIEETFKRQISGLKGDEKIAVIIFDIDNFKKVNDTFGHEVGDDVLKYVAATLRKSVRTDASRESCDYFGRWGGEEFLVILPYQDAAAGALVAERIRKNIAATAVLPDGRNITVSLGVSVGRAGDQMDEVYKKADAALYEAKGNGKNQVRLAPDSLK